VTEGLALVIDQEHGGLCSTFSAQSAFDDLDGSLIYLQKARISPDAAFSVLDWSAYLIFIVIIGGGRHDRMSNRRCDRVLRAAALPCGSTPGI
jgi:hypothetical protein